MKCPFCSFADSLVKDSRPSEDGGTIKRRRQCPSCGARFTTLERVELRELKVIKRNGDIKLFDVNKIVKSINVATRKRPINHEQVDDIVSKILMKLEKYGEGEVQSKIIGELIMEELSKIDEVAYVRYASVYKDFSKASDFGNFIAKIKVDLNEGKK
jgi:transcriptional repressor NrdR